jgi:ATP/ADP translocase
MRYRRGRYRDEIEENEKRDYSGATKGGIGFFGLLAIVFITLKLIGIIDWSWIWVLAPLWCPPVLAVVGILLLAVIAYFTDKIKMD